MSVLFTPVGTADPITQLGDGPMLHIVRHYKPERVVLFLSREMQGHQDEDGRYTDAIERLCASEDREIPAIDVITSEIEDVWRFDVYIGEFEHILAGLCAESPDEPVLVNVTSGTPQMESALVALGAFGRLDLKLLQVTTPRRGPNKRRDREKPGEYDCNYMWELNEMLREEDPESRESRVVVVESPRFGERLLRENIVRLVEAYDYEAALELTREAHAIDEDTRQMIEAARDRLNLDGRLPAKVYGGTPIAYRPNDLLGEYLSVMKVRFEQGHWADFVRMMTPALTELYKRALRESGLSERAYLRYESGKPTNELNWNAIESDERLSRVFGTLRPGYRYVSEKNLSDLVEEYLEDGDVKTKLQRLRHVEKECRNVVAHGLVASGREKLERLGGLSLDTVMVYLFNLHGNVRVELYDDINRAIVGHL